MISALIVLLGYAFIAAVFYGDCRRVNRKHRLEVRMSHGKRTAYLRSRKTGRLIGCSNNPFTLILQGDNHE